MAKTRYFILIGLKDGNGVDLGYDIKARDVGQNPCGKTYYVTDDAVRQFGPFANVICPRVDVIRTEPNSHFTGALYRVP